MMKTFALIFCILFSNLTWGQERLVLFSMNLHCALDNWTERVDAITDEIVSINPDVIGLQEVCLNKDNRMTEYILRNLSVRGYEVKSWQTLDTHRTFFKYQEQLLIISKHEAQEIQKGYLPSFLFRNGYVGLKIQDIWFVTTHLHFAFPTVRKTQYRKLQKIYFENEVIVFGDMNSGPDTYDSTPFDQQGWQAYFDGPTYPFRNPKKVFDGFWVSPALAESVRDGKAERVFLEHEQELSDHLGIKISLDLE